MLQNRTLCTEKSDKENFTELNYLVCTCKDMHAAAGGGFGYAVAHFIQFMLHCW
jgi:hypothetical protein